MGLGSLLTCISSNVLAEWRRWIWPSRGGSRVMGVPQDGWFLLENPMNIWMMTGGSPILGNHHMFIICSCCFGSGWNGDRARQKSIFLYQNNNPLVLKLPFVPSSWGWKQLKALRNHRDMARFRNVSGIRTCTGFHPYPFQIPVFCRAVYTSHTHTHKSLKVACMNSMPKLAVRCWNQFNIHQLTPLSIKWAMTCQYMLLYGRDHVPAVCHFS